LVAAATPSELFIWLLRTGSRAPTQIKQVATAIGVLILMRILSKLGFSILKWSTRLDAEHIACFGAQVGVTSFVIRFTQHPPVTKAPIGYSEIIPAC
jgi:hypothetical protein